MPVILTSFKEYSRLEKYLGFKPRAYSIARYQPKGFDLPELGFLAPPLDLTIPRNHRSLKGYIAFYETSLKHAYTERWSDIKNWLVSLDKEIVTALVCWCPDTDLAKQQLMQFGCFACHTGLVGKMLNKHRPDMDVWVDRDHTQLVDEWLPVCEVIGSGPFIRQRSLFNTNQKEEGGGASWK